MFWPGLVFATIGEGANQYHRRYPRVSITDKFATAVAYAIRSVPGLIPWHLPVADVARVSGVFLMLLSLSFWWLKRLNRSGGTKIGGDGAAR